jgi:PIN domain-containing protein
VPPQRSGKPSGASSPLKPPPESFVLFLDEGLGQHVIAEALRAAGARVEIHARHFAPGTADETWLSEVARRGWVALTKDHRIRYREQALRAIRRSSARVVVLKKSGENLSGIETAAIFVKALPAIYRLARKESAPYIAKVARNGKVVLWWPERPRRSGKRRPGRPPG